MEEAGGISPGCCIHSTPRPEHHRWRGKRGLRVWGQPRDGSASRREKQGVCALEPRLSCYWGLSEWERRVLWLQGCPADRNWQCPSTGTPGQWEDHSSGCCLQPSRAPLAEGEGTWREPKCFPSPAQILPSPSPLFLLANNSSAQWVSHFP